MPAGDGVVALVEGELAAMPAVDGVVAEGVDDVVEEDWEADEEAADWLMNDLRYELN